MKNNLQKLGFVLAVLSVAVLVMTGAAAADNTITYSWDGSTLTFSGNSNDTLTQDIVNEALDAESAVSPYNVVISGIGTIGQSAFEFCSDMTSVTLTDSVTSIGDGVFFDCYNLTSVFIGAGVTSIGDGVFVSCESLAAITVSPENTAYCSEDGVLFTKDKKTLYAFPAAKSGRYTIPAGVTAISNYAFYECEGLTSVTIPSGVTAIGSHAFFSCDGLTSVSIPEGVISVGEEAFNGCTGLTSVSIPSSLTTISDAMFNNCSSLTSVTIPSGVVTLGSFAFAFCEGLNSVTIPDSVTSIGEDAFDCCTGLTSVTIPSGVTFIGDSVFSNCYNLSAITVSPENTAYCSEDGVLFTKDKKLLHTFPEAKSGEYTIPDGVTTINTHAFHFNGSLTSVTMPESLTTIGDYAFIGCSGLNSVTIPKNVTSVGRSAFARCTSLKEITIPDRVTSIGRSAFENCSSLKSVQLPEGITVISTRMFYECTSLEEITIPDNVTSIGSYAFENCSSLKSVEFGSNSQLEKTGSYAFYGIGSSVILPISQKEGYTFNNWVDDNGNILADRTITQENASSKYHVDWVEPEPEIKTNSSSSSTVSFRGIKDGNDFIFKNAVVIKKATLPGATSATIINNGIGTGWYKCTLSTDGFTGTGTLYFQVPLDVIDIKGWTVNDVSLLGCPTTYLGMENQYAKYSASVEKDGTYTIGFEKDAANTSAVSTTVEEPKKVTETTKVDTTPVTTTKVDTPAETQKTTETVKTTATTEKTTTEQKQTATKSPIPVLCILAGIGAAVVLIKRRH